MLMFGCTATIHSCQRLRSITVVPDCADDLLLHFPYDVDYDDISCHNAKGYAYGDGTVDIVSDVTRGMVAEFDGQTRLEVMSMVFLLSIIFLQSTH